MKKIISLFLLLILLFTSMSTSMVKASTYSDAEISEMLIGTWRRERSDRAVLVFREDGTGLVGSPGGRREFSWTFYNNELQIPTGWARRYSFESLEDNVLTVSYHSTGTGGRQKFYETYVFYSEATDLYEEERWQLYVFAIPSIVLIVIGILIYIFWDDLRPKSKRRKNAKKKNGK